MTDQDTATTSQTETALQIIAGLRPAWAHWNQFFPGKDIPPQEDERIESIQQYQDRLGILVRKAACEWITECFLSLSSSFPLPNEEDSAITPEEAG